jgi:hypothetical protein
MNAATHSERTNVVYLFQWKTERANARATEAQEHARANPGNTDAQRYAYDAMGEYVRAARQRNEAERRARERRAQELSDSLRNGSYIDPRPGGR